MKIDLNEILIENGNYPRVKFQTIFVPTFMNLFFEVGARALDGWSTRTFLFNIHLNEFFNEQWNIGVWRKGKLKRELITNTNKVNFLLFPLLPRNWEDAISNKKGSIQFHRNAIYDISRSLYGKIRGEEGKRILTVGAHVDRRPCDLGIDESRSNEQNSGQPYTQTCRTHLTNSPDNRHFPRFQSVLRLNIIFTDHLPAFPPPLSPSIAHRSAVSSILFLSLL